MIRKQLVSVFGKMTALPGTWPWKKAISFGRFRSVDCNVPNKLWCCNIFHNVMGFFPHLKLKLPVKKFSHSPIMLTFR